MDNTENVDIYPKCPHCHCEIEYGDELSNDYDDAYYFVSWSGFCPECQRTFTFSETFKMVERRFLSEEDPD